MSSQQNTPTTTTRLFAVVFDQFPCHNEGEIKFVQHLQGITRKIVEYDEVTQLVAELEAMLPESMQFKAVHFYDKRIDSNVITFTCSNSAETARTVAHFFPVKE